MLDDQPGRIQLKFLMVPFTSVSHNNGSLKKRVHIVLYGIEIPRFYCPLSIEHDTLSCPPFNRHIINI